MFHAEHFWRTEPLSGWEELLLKALVAAHHASAFRDNPSSIAVAQAAAGSGQLEKAIAAGLMTIGGRHGPLRESAELLLLDDPAFAAKQIVYRGRKVPGWGGAFQKDAPDPIWSEVKELLSPSQMADKLNAVTTQLHLLKKPVYPNPSGYTAAVAILIGLPASLTPYLFIASRLTAWTQLAAGVL